jgi:hypothetical protein
MAEEERTPDLGRLTVTEYLFQTRPYKVGVGLGAGDPLWQQDPPVWGNLSLVPKRPYLPRVSAQAETRHGGAVAKFSLSPQGTPVSYSREYRHGDVPSTKDIVQGEAGPFRARYSELRGGGERGLEERAYGASAQMGPVTLYGEQSDASWEGRDPRAGQLLRNMEYAKYLESTRIKERNRKIGAAIGGPFGSGVAGLDVARTYRESLQPNWRGQPRPTVSAPHTTSFRGHWQGPLGPGRLGLQGGVTSERGIGTSSNLGANYVIEDPLGLGGRLNAHAGWQNPYGEPSNWQAGVRYGLRW